MILPSIFKEILRNLKSFTEKKKGGSVKWALCSRDRGRSSEAWGLRLSAGHPLLPHHLLCARHLCIITYPDPASIPQLPDAIHHGRWRVAAGTLRDHHQMRGDFWVLHLRIIQGCFHTFYQTLRTYTPWSQWVYRTPSTSYYLLKFLIKYIYRSLNVVSPLIMQVDQFFKKAHFIVEYNMYTKKHVKHFQV